MIKVKWRHRNHPPLPDAKIINDAITKAVRKRIKNVFGVEYRPPHDMGYLKVKVDGQWHQGKWRRFSRDHIRSEWRRCKRRRAARKQRRYWEWVNDRKATLR